ncbi:microtubule binding protein [Dendrothele bispora CBS 962.96]|uniref:Microtubule binding protein n=1 Tax=Dendrothele bispora (strain CBS 962.96) TaxID=1314807 RepID=A0A4S8LQ58_DENBC|nr:microtubule binding protein [Dendrothele bispora CBS 962.96]
MTSRVDLLEWLNNLLQINYTKIEQCGTGAAYCQIFDSIYGDVQLNKVNWKAQHEYQYIANFKVLQSAFTSKKVDRPILVERLVKCRMQDNLEFLQWMKRYWDQNYRGTEYDAIARRGGTGISMGGVASRPPSSKNTNRLSPSSAAGGKWSSGASATGSETTSGGSERGGRTAFSPFTGGSNAEAKKVKELREQLEQVSVSVETMTTERDFYFHKLRDVEDIVVGVLEGEATAQDVDEKVLETLRKIQAILYSGTEE